MFHVSTLGCCLTRLHVFQCHHHLLINLLGLDVFHQMSAVRSSVVIVLAFSIANAMISKLGCHVMPCASD